MYMYIKLSCYAPETKCKSLQAVTFFYRFGYHLCFNVRCSGRRLTKEGRRDMDRIANQVVKKQRKAAALA